MRPLTGFAFALVLLPLLFLQSAPASAQMSPGVSTRSAAPNPADASPPPNLVPPPAPNPAAASPDASAAAPAAAVSDTGGLCQCLNHSERTTRVSRPFENNTLDIRCMSAVEACKSTCQTDSQFSFVPHARFSCPTPPPEETVTGKVALNTR
jgi:hypothetical protein